MNAKKWFVPQSPGRRITLRVAALVTILALALTIWPLLYPTPLGIIAAASIGQLLGGLAAVAYGIVVAADLIRAHVFQRGVRNSMPPPSSREKP
jgi:hypothetical protein